MKPLIFALTIMTILAVGCTQQEGPDEPEVREVTNVLHVQLGAKVSDLKEVAKKLDSLESAEIKFDVKISGEIGFKSAESKAVRRKVILPGFSTGKITKKGSIK